MIHFQDPLTGRDGPSRAVTVRQHLVPRSQGLSSSHTSARILLPVRRNKFRYLTSAESGLLCLQSVRFSSGVLDMSELFHIKIRNVTVL